MAVLNETQRQAVRDTLIRLRDEFAAWVNLGGTKADVRAVVDAFDDYLETNAAAINQSIPVGPRGAFTTPQKAIIMAYVALKRAAG